MNEQEVEQVLTQVTTTIKELVNANQALAATLTQAVNTNKEVAETFAVAVGELQARVDALEAALGL